MILVLILLLGFFFRIIGLNWDQNSHLHPDERFLTMVSTEMKTPSNFLEYLDPSKSKFNPANIGFPFYVYGISPVTFNKLLAMIDGNNDYNNLALQGRFLSAVADFLVIIFIFLFLRLAEKKYNFSPLIKFFASFIYACSVLPIQLSHFFCR